MKYKGARVQVEVLRETGYGSVPDMDDSELAGPGELMRIIALEQWGSILELPVEPVKSHIRPTIDERGNLDWGAFGTVDFDRMFPFDKSRYVLDLLREELRIVLIAFDVLKERLSVDERLEVIRHVDMDKDIDLLENWDQWFLAKRYLQAKGIRRQISQHRSYSYGKTA